MERRWEKVWVLAGSAVTMCHAHAIHNVRPEVLWWIWRYSHSDNHAKSSLQTTTGEEGMVCVKVCQVILICWSESVRVPSHLDPLLLKQYSEVCHVIPTNHHCWGGSLTELGKCQLNHSCENAKSFLWSVDLVFVVMVVPHFIKNDASVMLHSWLQVIGPPAFQRLTLKSWEWAWVRENSEMWTLRSDFLPNSAIATHMHSEVEVSLTLTNRLHLHAVRKPAVLILTLEPYHFR